MAPIVSVARQARVLTWVALVGAVPLTVGVVFWIVGSVMQAAYHGHWGGTAATGQILVVAGLICGLVMFVLAANGDRWVPRGPGGGAGQDEDGLLPLASPEQQALLADPVYPQPPQPPLAPPPLAPPPPQPLAPPEPEQAYLPGGPYPPGQFPPNPQFQPEPQFLPAPPFPPDRPWPEPGPPPDWGQGYPDYPGPGLR